METVSQQTVNENVNTGRHLFRKFCTYIAPVLVGLSFVIVALIFAIIFTGYGNKQPNRLPKAPVSLCNTTNFRVQQRNKLGSNRRNIIRVSSIFKYPFMSALIIEKPRLYLCASVILTTKYLLTGANCIITNFKSLFIKVKSDSWDDEKGKLYGIESIIIHEMFNGVTQENNLALIKVNGSIKTNNKIKFVKFAPMGPILASTGIVLGWNVWAATERNHTMMMEQKLQIWKPKSCKKFLQNEPDDSKLICASLITRNCNLELTGPLVVRGKLLGFWSWGLSCLKIPSIFTDIRYYKKWIKENTF